MLRPANEVRAVAADAARAQAEKDAAKAERFVRDTVAGDIDAAAALGRTFTVLVGERLPSDAACRHAVTLLEAAGYSVTYEPAVTFDIGLTLSLTQTVKPASLTVRWSA